jgi:hypothetical protein
MFLIKKSRLLIVSFLLILCIFSCSPRIKINSAWQAEPPGIADQTTWLQNGEYDERSNFHIHLSNDRENLYILLQTSDEPTMMKMLRAGMELTIDTLGKNNGHCSVVFPIRQETMLSALVPVRNGGRMNERESGGWHEQLNSTGGSDTGKASGNKERYKRLIDQQKHAMIHGFKYHRDGRTSIDSESGITVMLDMDSTNMLYYKAIIPLYTFYKELETSADTLKRFGLTININGIDVPQRPMGSVPGAGSTRPEGIRPGTPDGGNMVTPGQSGMGGGRGATTSRHRGSDWQGMHKDLVMKTVFYLTFQ